MPQVDKAVVSALASALEESPEEGAAALRAAVRRHAIVEVQVHICIQSFENPCVGLRAFLGAIHCRGPGGHVLLSLQHII